MTRPAGAIWTWAYTSLLSSTLNAALSSYANNIRTYIWDVGCVATRHRFPALTRLESRHLRDEAEVAWFNWHLRSCRIRTLKLSLSWDSKLKTGSRVFDEAILKSVQSLCLERVSLEGLEGAALRELELVTLDLKLCPGTAFFLTRLPQQTKLKHVRIASSIPREVIDTFLKLSSLSELEEISLRLGVQDRAFVPDGIYEHAASLRVLVLDSRRILRNLRSCFPFRTEDLHMILKRLPGLRVLGMPLNMDSGSGERYRRAKIQVSVTLRLLNQS